MVLTIILADDGGTDNGGANASSPHHLQIHVYDSLVSATVTITHAASVNFSAAEVSGAFARALAHPSILASASIVHAAPNATILSLTLYGVSSEQSQALAGALPGVAAAVAISLGALEVVAGSPVLSMSYCGSVPGFELDTDSVTVEQHEFSEAEPFLEEDFALNVTRPPFTPLDANLSEVVTWRFTPIRHRLFTDSWVSDGSPSGLFLSGPSLQPVCAPACTSAALFFVPAPDFFGEAVFSVSMSGAAGGVVRTLSVEILYSNAAPSFALSQTEVVVWEDQVANLTFRALARNVSSGPYLSDANQTVSMTLDVLTLTPDGESAFSLDPDMLVVSTPDGNSADLYFEPASDVFGNFTVEVAAEDDGGVKRHGENRSEAQNLTVVILPVNDPPVFSLFCTGDSSEGPNQDKCFETSEEEEGEGAGGEVSIVVRENCVDCLAGSIASALPVELAGCVKPFVLQGFATNISAHPRNASNEAGQILSFTVEAVERLNGTVALFTPGGAPRIDARTGTLTFCLAPDVDGNASFLVKLTDDGGTARGGANTSTTNVTLTVRVRDVNVAPSFSACCGAHLAICADGGYHRIPSFFLGIMAGKMVDGGDNEAGQKVSFVVEADEEGVFSLQPRVNASGDLEFTLAGAANGTFNLDVRLRDDGGVANGGVDTSVDVTVVGYVYDSFVTTHVRIAHADGAPSVNDTLLGVIASVYASFLEVETVLVSTAVESMDGNETVVRVKILTLFREDALSIDGTLDNYTSSNVTVPGVNVSECDEVPLDDDESNSTGTNTTGTNTTLECNTTTLPPTYILSSIPESIALSAPPGSIITLTPASPFLANCLNRPDFLIPDASIPLTQFLYPLGSPLIRPGFITNISARQGIPLDPDGIIKVPPNPKLQSPIAKPQTPIPDP